MPHLSPPPLPAALAAPRRPTRMPARLIGVGAALALLGGCASSGVGIGIGVLPGLSLSFGVGAGGPSVGVGTGWGPVGAGVSVNGSGRVVAGTGVGIGAGPVGVGLGGPSAVLYDPQARPAPPSIARPAAEPGVVVRRSGAAARTPGDVEAP